jgi:hypothetical protein
MPSIAQDNVLVAVKNEMEPAPPHFPEKRLTG